jgi:hypothetical protein
LILYDENEKAFVILEELKGKTLTEREKEKVLDEVKQGANSHLKVGFKEIFYGKNMLLTSILLMFIWMIGAIVFYGPILIGTLTLKELNIQQKKDSNIIVSQMFVNIIGFIGFLAAGPMSEIPALGRNKTTIIGVIVASIFNVLTIMFSEYYEIFFALFLTFLGIANNVNSSYSCEVYPTKIRDFAMGFLFFVTRIGGFISQILYVWLHNTSLWAPYHATIAFLIIYCAMVFFLPIETYYRPLDEEMDAMDVKYTENDSETEHLKKKD